MGAQRCPQRLKTCSQRTNCVDLNWPGQVDPDARRVHWSRASASRLGLYFVSTGCSETRPASARSVLDTRIAVKLEFAICCELALREPEVCLFCIFYPIERRTLVACKRPTASCVAVSAPREKIASSQSSRISSATHPPRLLAPCKTSRSSGGGADLKNVFYGFSV